MYAHLLQDAIFKGIDSLLDTHLHFRFISLRYLYIHARSEITSSPALFSSSHNLLKLPTSLIRTIHEGLLSSFRKMSNLGYISWKMWLERLRLGLVKDHIFVSRKSSFFLWKIDL
jgi:hypothetical protein